MLIRICIAIVLLLIAKFVPMPGAVRIVLFAVTYLVIGYDILKKAAKGIGNGRVFDENFLMAVATIGAWAVGSFDEAVGVMLFYRVGELGRGDMIYTDAGGRTVAWRVDRRYTVDPGSKAERRALRADGGHPLLPLSTCDPPGLNTRRLLVRAHRVLTLTLMTALHPTAQIMRHSSRKAGTC